MSKNGIRALRRAQEMIGTQAALAETVGVSQPYVNHVLRNGEKVPAEWCLKIEAATDGKITRHELRPDLYPSEAAA